MSRHSDADDAVTDSDVSELENHDIGASSNAVTQLGFAEDPEEPLTADSFPSKSGGQPVSQNSERDSQHQCTQSFTQTNRLSLNYLIAMAQP